MPKYIVTNGSNFQPFTYDELAKPIQQMAEAHNAAQDAYDALSMETAALGRYISDNEDDKQAKALYDEYNNRLRTLQDNLWNNGYTSSTRKDLSAAKTGYAGDIKRLQEAIKSRQEKSKEYWDTKHKHPDMIMGADPGLSGLDNYLNDDTYGQNYYSYSGTQFMEEVGTDAKARANEMLRDPRIINDPRLAGYITRIKKDGFTSQEVMAASQAVRSAIGGDNTAIQNLDPASTILADVLMNHLNSTGAAGNVSAEEFNRLFDYGVSGLSQAIGKTDVQYMSDKVWDFNKQIALQNHSHALSEASRRATAAAKANAGNTQNTRGYSMDELSTFMKNRESDKATGIINKYFVKPFNKKPILKDGTVINNPAEAEDIINRLGRQDIISKFGIDPVDAKANENGRYDGKDIKIARKAESIGSSGVKIVNGGADTRGNGFTMYIKNNDGKWEANDELYKEYNSMLSDFNLSLNKFKTENPDVKIEDLIISRNDWEKIRKKNNIPDTVANDDIPDVLATQAGIGRITPAEIAPSTRDMDTTRENYARFMIEASNRAKAQQGKLSKTDESLFYPVNKGSIAEKGVGAEDVFGKKGDNELSSVYVYPEDLARNKVRVVIGGKEYAVNPAMLGNNMDAQVRKLREPIAEIMTPITNPSKALSLSDKEYSDWLYITSYCLGDYMPKNNNGQVAAPADIVRNPQLQSELRAAVNEFMSSVISDARDNMMLNNYQVRGNTSSKAEGYNDYYGE